MPYELSAVIGRFDPLRSRIAGVREATVAPLRQRMGLVPVTGRLLEELTGSLNSRDSGGSAARPFTLMSPAFDQILGDWSHGGPIGYVEADFHGGDGYQTSAVWRSGSRVWGPARTWDFTGPRDGWPINAALARLGVVASSCEEADHHDLFLEVGLGGEQDMDGWRSAGRRAEWARDYDEWHEEWLAERERRARAAEESERYKRLPDVPVMLDGKAIMELLGIAPGPLVGAATRYLQDLRLERGPLSRDEAVAGLRAWAMEQDLGRRGR